MNSPEVLSENSRQERELTLVWLLEIVNSLREAVLIVNDDMRIVAANRVAVALFPQQDESLDNKRLAEAIRDVSIHDAFKRALVEDELSEVQYESRRNDGEAFNVSVRPLVLGETTRAMGVFYDTTQIGRLENVRQEFLSNVSHELRTPLTSILAFVETLENGGINDESNNLRFLEIIRKNAERMRMLIDDISELSSIEAGKIKITPRNIDLSNKVNDVFTNLSAKANEKNIKLRNKIGDDCEIIADEFRLEQMITNLVDNGIKFNHDGGSVTIRLKRNAKFNIIKVSDTGEGIQPEQIPRIFERLYRADRARSREIGGTGLGLAIVKHLALLHNGQVKVTSDPDKGSTFTIRLPIIIAEG
jgi:two-component system phosphate regulon sensor histidine kinase PhoR